MQGTRDDMGEPTITVGSRVGGRYEILDTAGRGGMGTVFRAHDHHSGSLVAVKILSQPHTQASDRERFLREGNILASLRHPGIVGHVDHGFYTPEVPFLVMEWLLGEDLASYLSRARLKVSQSVALARRIAEALAVAHQHGVVHRDLKPSDVPTESEPPDTVPSRPRSACCPTRMDAEGCPGSLRLEAGGRPALEAAR